MTKSPMLQHIVQPIHKAVSKQSESKCWRYSAFEKCEEAIVGGCDGWDFWLKDMSQ